MPWMLPAAVAGSSVIGGLFGKSGANKAASAEKDASNIQLQMFNQTAGRLSPFVSAGAAELPQLNALQPGTMTEAQLQAMPGYQFILGQGLKATQNAAAARGLGVSGAALKGAAQYATGLADQTYTNAFNQQQTKFQNALNIATLGENAAAGTGQQGTAAAAQAGNFLGQAGMAQAAGLSGTGASITGAGQNLLNYSMLQQMLHPTGPGTAGYGESAANPYPSGGYVQNVGSSPYSNPYQAQSEL